MAWRYIAVGFRTDCFKLLSEFQDSSCHTYKRFTEIWNEMKFSYIYYERKSFCELIEFTEEVFTVCKEFLYPPNSLPFQIGSIYLMYGLYLKQPTRNHVKIRFTMLDWNLLKKVWNITLSLNDSDVALIISRLCHMNAIHFCFTKRQMGLEKKFRKYYEGGEKSTGEMLPMAITPVMEQLNMQVLENVCDIFYQYEEARNGLNSVLFAYTNAELKEHFSTAIIKNMKTSVLEMIEKESWEFSRYCRLHGPTDSEDSNEEINEGEDIGIPWWQCKKKMPWWKHCLPFGKQTGKNRKRGRANDTEDSSELSLEEDIDDPDIVYFSDKERLSHIGKKQTIIKDIIIDSSSLSSEDNMVFGVPSHSASVKNRRMGTTTRVSSKASNFITSNSSVSSEGTMVIDAPTNPSYHGSKRNIIKRKKPTAVKNTVTDISSVLSEISVNIAEATHTKPRGSKRNISRGKKQTVTKDIITDISLVSSEGNACFGVPSHPASTLNRRKTSKGKKLTVTKDTITDISSLSSQGNASFGVPSHPASAANRRNISKGKKETVTKAVIKDISLLFSKGSASFGVPSHPASTVNRRMTSKGKKQTVTKDISKDISLLSSEGNASFCVPSHPASTVDKRKTNKGKIQTVKKDIITDTSLPSSQENKSLGVPRHPAFTANRRKGVTRKIAGMARKLSTDNSSVSSGGNINVAVPIHLPYPLSKSKIIKRKKITKTEDVTDISSLSLESNINVLLSTHTTSPGNKRRKRTGKTMAQAKVI